MATRNETTKAKKGRFFGVGKKDKKERQAQIRRTNELHDKCGKYVLASESEGEEDEIRVVLIGKTGAGKSMFGNNLLQKEAFAHGGYSQSVTNQCQFSQRRLDSKTTLSVIDSPGLFDTKDPEISKEIFRSIVVASPGPHVYIFVISVGRHTQEQIDTVENLLEMFGEEVVKHVIVVFTRKDDLDASKSPAEFIRSSPDSLQNLLKRCEYRYAFINNKAHKDELRQDVGDILDLIYKTIGENKGDYYTNEIYERAYEVLEARRMEIGTEKEHKEEQLLHEQNQIFEDATKVNFAEMNGNRFLNDFREFAAIRQMNRRDTKKIEKQKRFLTLKMKGEDIQLVTRGDERQKNEEELRQYEEQMSRLEEDDKIRKLERKIEKQKEQIDASGDSCLAQTVRKLVEVNEKLVDNDRINPNREAKDEVETDEKILKAVGSAVMKVGLKAGSAALSAGSGAWGGLMRWLI